MPSSNPSKQRAEKYRQFLIAAGWKTTRLTVFGVEQEAWVNPRSGRPSTLLSAYATARAKRRKEQRKKT